MLLSRRMCTVMSRGIRPRELARILPRICTHPIPRRRPPITCLRLISINGNLTLVMRRLPRITPPLIRCPPAMTQLLTRKCVRERLSRSFSIPSIALNLYFDHIFNNFFQSIIRFVLLLQTALILPLSFRLQLVFVNIHPCPNTPPPYLPTIPSKAQILYIVLCIIS